MGKRNRKRKELIRQGREDLVHRSTVLPTTDNGVLSLFHPEGTGSWLRIPGGRLRANIEDQEHYAAAFMKPNI